MPKDKSLTKRVLKTSEGIASCLTDLALFFVFFNLEILSAGQRSRYIYNVIDETFNDLQDINYEQIKRALSSLKNKKLITQTKKEEKIRIKITKSGRKRLYSKMPIYKKERTWDKKFYLVLYDIPTNKNRTRDILREYLKKIGCGKLQNSVWLTPYNPKKALKKFCIKNKILDNIIVSTISKDDSIGYKNIQKIINDTFKLDKLNDRYREFLKLLDNNKLNKLQANFTFLSILNDDPQLPFELLPKDWVGDKAYERLLQLA